MSEVFNFIYRGGVKVEDDVRYLTAEKPPTDDNSNKVPTTEWVQEKIDNVEAAVSGGMFPTIKNAELKGDFAYAPSGGGTWWCHGDLIGKISGNAVLINGAYASGALLRQYTSRQADVACIKIA